MFTNTTQPQPPVVRYVVSESSGVEGKSKVAAGLFGIFLGGFGVHKFYMGKVGMGILYLLFCWTFIPALIGLIEGIIYLCESDEEFARKCNS